MSGSQVAIQTVYWSEEVSEKHGDDSLLSMRTGFSLGSSEIRSGYLSLLLWTLIPTA